MLNRATKKRGIKPTVTERASTVMSFAEIDQKNLASEVKRYLADQSPTVRAASIGIVRKKNLHNFEPDVLALLSDKNHAVRYTAAECLGAPDEDATGSLTGIHFTGKERDAESGLDYFGARYYGSSMGRFMSPDPINVTSARQMDPQQLNLYAYVRNNPLSLTDPSGMIINTYDLNDKDKALWAKIVALANKQDADGNYVNPALHSAYSALDRTPERRC